MTTASSGKVAQDIVLLPVFDLAGDSVAEFSGQWLLGGIRNGAREKPTFLLEMCNMPMKPSAIEPLGEPNSFVADPPVRHTNESIVECHLIQAY